MESVIKHQISLIFLKFSNGSPYDPFKRDDDHGRPGNPQTPPRTGSFNDVDVEAQHLATPGSEYRRAWPGRMYDYLQDRFPWRKSTVARTNTNLQESDLPSAPTHQPVGPGSGQRAREAWTAPVNAQASGSSTTFDQESPTLLKRRGRDQADEVLGNYSRVSLDEERVSSEQQEAVNSIVNFWDWFKPKLIAPKVQPQYHDPYADVRSDPYLYDISQGKTDDPYSGQNVWPVQSEWGYKTSDKSEQAILRLVNQFDAGEDMSLDYFSGTETSSELGDVPPSLTADNSSISDNTSEAGDLPVDPIEEALTDFMDGEGW